MNLLRRRASRLAAPLPSDSDSGTSIEILVFTLSGECYALPIEKIGRVAPCQQLCPIPGTPEHILGITNVDGELLPIVDLGPRFGLGRGESRADSRIIVLESAAMRLGLFAERVIGSESVRDAELKPSPHGGNGPASYMLYVMSNGTALLNADAILADDSLIVRNE